MLLLHLSDIHFKHSEIKNDNDPNLALRDDLIEDVKYIQTKLGRTADAILISGDIAFAGNEQEYHYAFKWLEERLCPASKCDLKNVMVIPGNHDVDRGKTRSRLHTDARENLRKVEPDKADSALREYLADSESAKLMFGPIENYNKFAAAFICALGAYDVSNPESKPYVVRNFELNDGSTLRVWGFNSALISNEQDVEGNMFVDPKGAQIERENGVVHAVMCHHPYSWLRNKSQFRERLEAVAKLHMFGHEHTRRVDRHQTFTSIRAGAVQPDRDDREWKPGYNWVDISVLQSGKDRKLRISVWVRQKEGARYIAIPDEEHQDPWVIEHQLPLWNKPGSPRIPELVAESADTADVPVQTVEDLDPRNVAINMFRLPEHLQRRVIVEQKLDKDGDSQLTDYVFALTAIGRSQKSGNLHALNSAISELLVENGETKDAKRS